MIGIRCQGPGKTAPPEFWVGKKPKRLSSGLRSKPSEVGQLGFMVDIMVISMNFNGGLYTSLTTRAPASTVLHSKKSVISPSTFNQHKHGRLMTCCTVAVW